jgi:hypothetical protein
MSANRKQRALKHQRAVSRSVVKHHQAAGPRRAIQSPLPPGAIPSTATTWPVLETLISSDWEEPGELVQILVARASNSGRVAAAAFLIDLGCLGVKNAMAIGFDSMVDYMNFREDMTEVQDFKIADINLAARIIREAVRYARDLGFQPHRDLGKAMMILGSADPDAPNVAGVEIPVGEEDGKPLFISGPHDNVRAILYKLTERCGPDGFHFAVGGPKVLDLVEIEEDEAA